MTEAPPPYLILAVEESASSLAFYDPDNGHEVGRVELSLWPHEISVAEDGFAYVTNFGVRDYDLSLGYAGNSISCIDIARRAEVGRLFTRDEGNRYWAPHGVKVSPDGEFLFVNVERVLGTREPDLTRPGSEYTKLLKFERRSGKLVESFQIPLTEYDPRVPAADRILAAYDVVPGTHNFVFSPHDPNELWLFSGKLGVSVFDVVKGAITHRLQDFNGAVRSLSFGHSGRLLVSATNEVSLVDPRTKRVLRRFGDLGVGQILYSTLTPDEAHILAPAVWEGQILVISTATGKIVHRLTAGVDPVQVVLAPDGKRAYVSHGRTEWLSYINLTDLSRMGGKIQAKGGPNGVGFAPWSPVPSRATLKLAACLPFTGAFSAEGRELRLGYQHWQDKVNGAGGLVVDGVPCHVDIDYSDTGSALDSKRLAEIVDQQVAAEQPIMVLGSFPSAADAAIGRAAVNLGLPFLTATGSDTCLFDGGTPLAFSLAATEVCILEGVLKATRQRLNPMPRRVAILVAAREDHQQEARATLAAAKALGFEVVGPAATDSLILHEVGASSLAEQAGVIEDLLPDLLLIINDPRDAVTALHALAEHNYRPGGVALACDLTNPATLEKLGALAPNLMAGVGWTPQVVTFSEDRFGSGTDFARGYFQEFSEPAAALAAAGAAVGVVLEAALGSGKKPVQISGALANLKVDTFYSPVDFDHAGRNLGHSSIAIQINSKNETEIIWPPSVADRDRPRWPY